VRSLLSQLIWSHLAVAAGTLFVSGLLTSFLFSQYYVTLQERALTDQAEELAQTAASLMARRDSGPQLALLSNVTSRMVKGRVCIIDLRDATIAASSAPAESGGEGVRAGLMAQADDKPEVERTTLLCMTGPVISIKMPIVETGSRSRIGTLVFRCPISGLGPIPEAERAILISATVTGIILAFLAATLLTPALTRPLVGAAEAARNIAAGDFSARVAETGPGEMRSLAASVNTMAAELSDAFQRLEGERDRLRDLERMRRDFIANASHELRAPLTSIQGFVGALKDGTARTEEQQRRCIDVSLQQATIMRRLVDQLLELSRLQSGTIQLEKEPLDIADVVKDAVAGMTPQALAGGVELRVDAPSASVDGDGHMLSRVVANLLDNAIRVAPQGSAVEVSVTASADRARVTVSDRGPGILEEDLALIWERFYKADHAHTRDTIGAGLGLAIAKEIATRHGGAVGAENREDGGASIWFELPRTATQKA